MMDIDHTPKITAFLKTARCPRCNTRGSHVRTGVVHYLSPLRHESKCMECGTQRFSGFNLSRADIQWQ